MTKTFTAFAPPLMWGPWTIIESHGGIISFTITYTVIGDTAVIGKVRFYKEKDRLVEEEFNGTITFTTANVWANIEVSFKGLPLGSAVEGEIDT